MTSGNFSPFPLDSIIILRAERQRRELTGISELAESIASVGLINPPVVTRAGQLVAGERRVTACRSLGWDSIPVQFAEDLDPVQLQLLELEENVKRENLTWQDHAIAVDRYHKLRAELAADWTITDSAGNLGLSTSYIQQVLTVARGLNEGEPMVVAADTFSVARNVMLRKQERQRNAVLLEINEPEPEGGTGSGEVQLSAPARRASILQADFMSWAVSYSGPAFNFIHCDFPYGVGVDKRGQSSSKVLGSYSDTAGDYFDLVGSFLAMQDRFIAPQAHLMFWFSMDFYQQTIETFAAAGWTVSPFPLIWLKSDNKGILPDSNRGPRRVYETALFATRGDPKIVRAVGNAIACATTKDFHMSEKSSTMLEHFFRMLVDEYTMFLDPTCGGGNAVKVAEALGAQFALGIERNPEFADRARENLKLSA
jgi:ParB family chromosome partitioning protein